MKVDKRRRRAGRRSIVGGNPTERALSASRLAEMGFCERWVVLEHRHGRPRSRPLQVARERGLVFHGRLERQARLAMGLAMYRHLGRRGAASSPPWPSARDGRHRRSATSGMPYCDAEAGDGRSCTTTTAPVPASARCLKRLRHCSGACDGCSGRPLGCGGGGHERLDDEHDRSRTGGDDSCRRDRLRRMGHRWQARCGSGA